MREQREQEELTMLRGLVQLYLSQSPQQQPTAPSIVENSEMQQLSNQLKEENGVLTQKLQEMTAQMEKLRKERDDADNRMRKLAKDMLEKSGSETNNNNQEKQLRSALEAAEATISGLKLQIDTLKSEASNGEESEEELTAQAVYLYLKNNQSQGYTEPKLLHSRAYDTVTSSIRDITVGICFDNPPYYNISTKRKITDDLKALLYMLNNTVRETKFAVEEENTVVTTTYFSKAISIEQLFNSIRAVLSHFE